MILENMVQRQAEKNVSPYVAQPILYLMMLEKSNDNTDLVCKWAGKNSHLCANLLHSTIITLQLH